MVVLSKSLEKGIDVRDMKDGEIAVIVWGSYEGVIVQRFGNNLISLGKSCKQSWESILSVDRSKPIGMDVRVLQKGETLTIQ
jgi:hypothetical protein